MYDYMTTRNKKNCQINVIDTKQKYFNCQIG